MHSAPAQEKAEKSVRASHVANTMAGHILVYNTIPSRSTEVVMCIVLCTSICAAFNIHTHLHYTAVISSSHSLVLPSA